MIWYIVSDHQKRVNEQKARDEAFYRSLYWVESAALNVYNSRVEQYLKEDLFMQRYLTKIDPKELLLSKLKKQ